MNKYLMRPARDVATPQQPCRGVCPPYCCPASASSAPCHAPRSHCADAAGSSSSTQHQQHAAREATSEAKFMLRTSTSLSRAASSSCACIDVQLSKGEQHIAQSAACLLTLDCNMQQTGLQRGAPSWPCQLLLLPPRLNQSSGRPPALLLQPAHTCTGQQHQALNEQAGRGAVAVPMLSAAAALMHRTRAACT
jgi:hypothetical protein